MFISNQNRHHTHITTTGLKVVVVPRHALHGVLMIDGKPSAVKYPNHHYLSENGLKYYSTLKGINKADYDHIKPDLVPLSAKRWQPVTG